MLCAYMWGAMRSGRFASPQARPGIPLSTPSRQAAALPLPSRVLLPNVTCPPTSSLALGSHQAQPLTVSFIQTPSPELISSRLCPLDKLLPKNCCDAPPAPKLSPHPSAAQGSLCLVGGLCPALLCAVHGEQEAQEGPPSHPPRWDRVMLWQCPWEAGVGSRSTPSGAGQQRLRTV